MFERISRDDATRTEVYSDGVMTVTLVLPMHITSGLPCEVSVCIPEVTGEPEANAKVEGEDVPPATPEEFESLGADPIEPEKPKAKRR